jgi:hypothetical protein
VRFDPDNNPHFVWGNIVVQPMVRLKSEANPVANAEPPKLLRRHNGSYQLVINLQISGRRYDCKLRRYLIDQGSDAPCYPSSGKVPSALRRLLSRVNPSIRAPGGGAARHPASSCLAAGGSGGPVAKSG